MASLEKQLKVLSPCLNKSVSVQDLHIQLISKREEAYFNDQGKLLHALGLLKNQHHFFTFGTDFKAEFLFAKIKQLVRYFNAKSSVEYFSGDNGWNIKLNGELHVIGDISLFFLSRITEDTINTPAFIKNINTALKSSLPNGNFHYGYWADGDQAIGNNFGFILLFIPNGEEALLKKYTKFEWKNLGDYSAPQKAGVVKVSNKKDQVILSWRQRSTWLTVVLVITSIVIIWGVANSILHFDDRQIRVKYLLEAIPIVGLLLFLDYKNRMVELTCTKDKVLVKGGVIPFFPGFKRKEYLMKEIVRVWTKTIASNTAMDEGVGGISYSEAVFITTRDPKEIKLTNDLEKNEAMAIKSKIQQFLKKSESMD